ncbi:MAG: exodeoxyribonuclease VII large subunit [Gammaproteobacteria bacterium]|uniref:Exodeoxyribonuclease 7 large subunit n=1 Tax=Candidatus Thiopontia autotrophica TaxID=2841688 RepID=A0A8J6P973_9GAMM|nr:exodeoxyribonuclease VII large subunit [Candidatus Thiopontia autotrophica]
MELSSDRKVITVSQLNREARFLLERNFTPLWVEGEISTLSRPSSGHIYFTLKDDQAQIKCAMFRSRLNNIRFRPQSGQHVEIRGTVSLYEARGDYQLIAEHMKEGGEGVRQRAYEALKKKLSAEGLFAESCKKPIPSIPKRVGVISSPSGAAIHDILTVLERRFPALPVILYPTSVQGSSAEGEIIGALNSAQQRAECDLLIVARGGGSIEDLWSFNEESVARAIHGCSIPIISAVGHETDFTITDFVADHRAATPSAAAELVSPDREEQLNSLAHLEQRLSRGIERKVENLSIILGGLKRELRHPRERIRQFAQRLDEGERRLSNIQQESINRRKALLDRMELRLQHLNPAERISGLRQQLQRQHKQLSQALRHHLQNQGSKLSSISHALDALSPLATLGRGYSVTTTATGEVIRDAASLRSGDLIKTKLHQGAVISRVAEKA